MFPKGLCFVHNKTNLDYDWLLNSVMYIYIYISKSWMFSSYFVICLLLHLTLARQIFISEVNCQNKVYNCMTLRSLKNENNMKDKIWYTPSHTPPPKKKNQNKKKQNQTKKKKNRMFKCDLHRANFLQLCC